jgi:hypothetical protein
MADTQRDIRLQKPQHVRRLLNEVINELRHDTAMDKEKRARVLGYLANITLTSLKDGDLEERITTLESQLKEKRMVRGGIVMKNTRIARLEESLQQEKSLNIVLGSINYKENTMILCIDGFSGSTIDDGEKFIDDHPENHYYIFGDHSNPQEKS